METKKKDMYDCLVAYCEQDYVPMHMPGAKRNEDMFQMKNPYAIDITEIDGFDNMHHATGMIADAFARAAKLFGADETYFLVNGSSIGLLSAICGATKKKDKVIVARNCHRAVYNALYLNELQPVYVYPQKYEKKDITNNSKTTQNGKQEEKQSCLSGEIRTAKEKQIYRSDGTNISKGKVQQPYLSDKISMAKENQFHVSKESSTKKAVAMEHQQTENFGVDALDLQIYGCVLPEDVEVLFQKHTDVTAVILTSPTYEGMVSDVKRIAEITHAHGAVLIVDEAHGAHFPFHKAFPTSALQLGADLVIQSIHKTLPAFTQTALLHINGYRVDRERVKMYWDMYQSTSPSYLLLAGIDRCMTFLETEGKVAFENYIEKLCKLRERLSHLQSIRLLPVDDISKIVLAVENGKWLHETLLNKYHIQLEMAAEKYVIAMTSVCDKVEYYKRFAAALEEIDAMRQRQGYASTTKKKTSKTQERLMVRSSDLQTGAKKADGESVAERDTDKWFVPANTGRKEACATERDTDRRFVPTNTERKGVCAIERDTDKWSVPTNTERKEACATERDTDRRSVPTNTERNTERKEACVAERDTDRRSVSADTEPEKQWCGFCEAEVCLSPYEAQVQKEREGFVSVPLEQAAGRVAADGICFYPPGIPLVNKGERITNNIIDTIANGMALQLEVIGMVEEKGEVCIPCLKSYF